MPIAAIPFEQDVVAEATYFTGLLTVLLLLGDVTVTPANADETANSKKGRVYFCINSPA
jgi:hypothetical protein